MSATLGGYIKDLRMQKNISQLEIAFALGWKEPSRLSRIEQGKVEKPTRELVDKLAEAMKLNDEEKNRLYVNGSYLPTEEDIKIARKKLAPLMNEWPYPASSLDFSWRVVCSNEKLHQLYKLSDIEIKYIEENIPNVMEIIFAQNFNGKQDNKEFYRRALGHFLTSLASHNKEKWYLDLIKKLMENDLFRELWPKASQQNYEYDVQNFTFKTVGKLNFYDFMLPVFGDARFIIEYYVPADKKTFEFYKA